MNWLRLMRKLTEVMVWLDFANAFGYLVASAHHRELLAGDSTVLRTGQNNRPYSERAREVRAH